MKHTMGTSHVYAETCCCKVTLVGGACSGAISCILGGISRLNFTSPPSMHLPRMAGDAITAAALIFRALAANNCACVRVAQHSSPEPFCIHKLGLHERDHCQCQSATSALGLSACCAQRPPFAMTRTCSRVESSLLHDVPSSTSSKPRSCAYAHLHDRSRPPSGLRRGQVPCCSINPHRFAFTSARIATLRLHPLTWLLRMSEDRIFFCSAGRAQ
jgi:hypothetical protein